MSVRMDRNTAWFEPADWKSLAGNGIAERTKGVFHVNSDGLVSLLTAHFSAAFECVTLDDVAEHGDALEHLVHNVAGLPVNENRTLPTDPLQKRDYVDPAAGLGKIIQGRLGGQYKHAVQSRLVEKGRFLVSTVVPRTYTAELTGLTTVQQTRVWAVAISAELIDDLVLEGEVKRAYAAAVNAANNAAARMTAVPESAPVVLAAMDAQIAAASNARATAYNRAIEGKSSKEVAALDAAVTGLADSKVDRHMAALTSGSDESTDDS